MAKMTTLLSVKQIQNAKIKEKEYNLTDGNGLMLRIKTNGKKPDFLTTPNHIDE